LQELDAVRERPPHQQRIDAVGDHAKALGPVIARPLLVAGEKAWRLAVFVAGFDQVIDSRMEFRIIELPRGCP
jgi:hypothetical protein